MNDGRQIGIGDAVLKGALAGLAGGLALILVEKLEQEVLLPQGAAAPAQGEEAVRALASRRDVSLSRPAAAAAGAAAQLGYCALLGASLGIVASRVGLPAIVNGLALAGLSYAATTSSKGVLPRLGVEPPPEQQSIEKTMIPAGAHVAFGLTTAAVLEAVTA